MTSIPFFDNRRAVERVIPGLEAQLPSMLAQSTLVNGEQVRALEAALRDYTAGAHAVAVGNATDALVIALRAIGIGPGDEVIVPCYSFFASVSCILHVGAVPVFVDIEPDTYSLDVSRIEACITSRTRAIMPVHLFRQMADMDAVLAIARRHGLFVIEDSAEGIGMRHNGRHAGLLGHVGVLSFFPTKTLGALGDAGLVLTDDPVIAERARFIADNGRDAQGMAQLPGMNSRMDDLQALYLRLQLEHLEDDIARRARCVALYDDGLAAVGSVIRSPRVARRESAQRVVDYVYLIETEARDALARHLARCDIGTETYYPLPLHLQPACRHLGHCEGDFPVAEAASRRALALPLYPELTDEAIANVCARIHEHVRSRLGEPA
ncbi:MAG TPA: DegT/DnrJ/EryC1/StrS family aminotransferase [Burkholderiaceae bacterium]|nr:DegT/DnrJ/EryC1/StrS family aminotransferase [Burkholderiaceae bacterium]